MANKETIGIHVETTANTSGVDQADTSIKRLNGTVSVSTVDQFLLSSADKAQVAEFAFYDLEKEIARTGSSGDKLTPLISKISLMDTAARSGGNGVKNLGGFATQAGYQVTDFAVQVQGGTSAITAFSQQFPQLIGSFTQSGFSIKGLSGSILQLPIDLGTAISLTAVAVGIGAKLAVDAYAQMTAAQDAFTASVTRGKVQIGFQEEQQRKLNAQVKEESRLTFEKQVTGELERQEKTLKRIAALRGELDSLQVEAANQEVESARLRGGDVGLAQVNVLTAQLQAGIGKLQSNLQAADTAITTAENQAKLANAAYQNALADGLTPEKIAELGTALDTANAAVEDAKQAASDQRQIFAQAKVNLIRGSENGLAALEADVGAQFSPAAKKAADNLYKSFKVALDEGPAAAIAAIKVDTTAVTATATAKATEVGTGIAAAARDIDTTFAGLGGNVDKLIAIGNSFMGIVTRQAGQIEALQQQVNSLNNN